MIVALDKNFQPIKHLNNVITLVWHRKYYSCGQFILTMPSYDYDTNIAYIYSQTNGEAAIAQSVTIQDDTAQLSGFFIEKILDDKIIYPTFSYSGNIESCARTMIEQYKDDIPLLELGEALGLGTNIQMQETGEELGRRIHELYQSQELSYRLRYDYTDNKIYFETYEGRDLTQGQDDNPWVTFSEQRNNITGHIVTFDSSNAKNYAIVAGSDVGENRKIYILDKSNGGYKKKIFIDARDLQQGEKSLEEYNAELKQRGEEKLLEYSEIQNFEFTLSQTESEQYKKDFDLGDKVDITVPDVNLDFSARITEITETTKENLTTIALIVGEQKPTVYRKIQMRK